MAVSVDWLIFQSAFHRGTHCYGGEEKNGFNSLAFSPLFIAALTATTRVILADIHVDAFSPLFIAALTATLIQPTADQLV